MTIMLVCSTTGAPWELGRELITTMNVSAVVVGRKREAADGVGTPDPNDRNLGNWWFCFDLVNITSF